MVRPRMSAEVQRSAGRGFGAAGELYDAVRPGYPAALVDQIVSDLPGPTVCDLGAGTGKLSSALLARGCAVTAVDPDEAALKRNPALRCVGTAEEVPLPPETQDAVTVAQAWHWVDEDAAAAECARILRPGGRLWILINQLDVRQDWVLRLSRIMHAGDVYRPAWRPRTGPLFQPVEAGETEFATPVTVDDIVSLAATRSYWLRSPEHIRQRVESNIRHYLSTEHPVDPREPFDLPYLCLSYRAVRLG